jgi:hypothetical protein
MVSTDLLPGKTYRPNPLIRVHKLDTIEEVDAICRRFVRGYPDVHIEGCARLPHDPEDVCNIFLVDIKRWLLHETGHCFGFADTSDLNKKHPTFNKE